MLRQIKVTINVEVNVNESEKSILVNELISNKSAMDDYINNELITMLEEIDENKLKHVGLERITKNSHLKEVLENIDEDSITENIEQLQKNIVTEIKSIEVV